MFTALAWPGSEGLLSEAEESVNSDMCIVSIQNCVLYNVVLAKIHTLFFCDNLRSLDGCISKFQKCDYKCSNTQQYIIFLTTYQSGIRHTIEEFTHQICPPHRASGGNQKIQS